MYFKSVTDYYSYSRASRSVVVSRREISKCHIFRFPLKGLIEPKNYITFCEITFLIGSFFKDRIIHFEDIRGTSFFVLLAVLNINEKIIRILSEYLNTI